VFQIVLFDQRGCGDSRLHASSPATDMAHNATEHVLADMEALREHLGTDRWLLYDGLRLLFPVESDRFRARTA
jgi:proline iminopeptidase